MNRKIFSIELLKNKTERVISPARGVGETHLFSNFSRILLFTALLVLSLTTLSFTIEPVEERNPLPFYYLPPKPSKIKLSLKDHKLCRVKLKEVVEYKKIETIDCYEIDKKFSSIIKLISKKNDKKNEINLMFIDANNKIVNPELHTPNGNYTIKSILYLRKDKSNHIELLDKNGGYYYFTYDPLHITVGE